MSETEKQCLSGSKQPIAIIGAGIIGISIACRLIRDHDQVLLIDPLAPGSATSFGNAGHIATEQIFPLASPETMLSAPRLLFSNKSPLQIRMKYALNIVPWLLRFAWASRPAAFRDGIKAMKPLLQGSLESMQRLCEDEGLSDLLCQQGHMIVAESTESLRSLAAKRSLLKQHGIESRLLAPEETAAKSPFLKRTIAGSLFLPGTGHMLNPHHLCTGLHKRFSEAGGQTLLASIKNIESYGNDGFILRHEAGEIMVDRLILATGAWSAPLARQLGHIVPLDTERGYHVTAEGAPNLGGIAVESHERRIIMTPMSCGLRITGFVEFGGLNLPPNPRLHEVLKLNLRELAPELELGKLSEWMGFRPSLPDMLPVIGESPANPKAIFAFGHHHLGLTLSAITADIVSALVAGRMPSVDLQPFRPNRF
ncbi:MAG: FAD-dependent oxidoreductase [Gammaproteobacteria bacterium]|nr:FAD-dependent oxidoreductase [Gammaproteobacteria bacterium]MCY4358101.1 FAD-dependent oxidoreductase [Gammaproteobacteria bacterium]